MKRKYAVLENGATLYYIKSSVAKGPLIIPFPPFYFGNNDHINIKEVISAVDGRILAAGRTGPDHYATFGDPYIPRARGKNLKAKKKRDWSKIESNRYGKENESYVFDVGHKTFRWQR